MAQTKRELKRERALELKRREINYQKVARKGFEDSKKVKVAPPESIISLQNVNKIYPNLVQAVFDFNLEVKDKEFIVFVGPSGCGKSTTLRMIAGLEDITAGDLYIDRRYANDMLPKKRNISMVFQSYALYPNMTVRENLAFGLKIKHMKKEEINERVEKAAKTLEIYDYLDRKPSALSGGQRQRVALGRAIVKASPVFLMDEPLSNLDAKLRVQMRSEIVSLHKKVGSTTIYVTHDQTEAMTMADRIVVMSKGRVQQIGTPDEVYSRPNNLFVATFIGAPAMNIVDATYKKGGLLFEDKYNIPLSAERVNAVEGFVKAQITKYNDLIKQTEESIEDRIKYITFKSVRYEKDALNRLDKNYSAKENLIRINISNLEKAIADGDYDGTREGVAELNKRLEVLASAREKELALINNRVAMFRAQEASFQNQDNPKIQAYIDRDEEIAVYNTDIANYKDKLAYYEKALKEGELAVKFGIRPEDIYCFSAKERAEVGTKEFNSDLTFVELLGYEYYLYFIFNGEKFIAKASNGKYRFESGVNEKFNFDVDKIHAFDAMSEEILF